MSTTIPSFSQVNQDTRIAQFERHSQPADQTVNKTFSVFTAVIVTLAAFTIGGPVFGGLVGVTVVVIVFGINDVDVTVVSSPPRFYTPPPPRPWYYRVADWTTSWGHDDYAPSRKRWNTHVSVGTGATTPPPRTSGTTGTSSSFWQSQTHVPVSRASAAPTRVERPQGGTHVPVGRDRR